MAPTPARAAAAAAHSLLRRTRCYAAASRIRPTARDFSSAPAGATEPQGAPANVAGVKPGDDELDVAIVGGGMVGLAVACALSNMPLTKHLRVAIIDSNPALKSRGYLKKDGVPDSRVGTVTPATISFFRGRWRLGDSACPRQRAAPLYLSIFARYMDIAFFGWSEIQVWEHHIDLIVAGSLRSARCQSSTTWARSCLGQENNPEEIVLQELQVEEV
ncbi:uncharacterized protein [Lolium perenne]|uniref:uncharacterized protein isoform X2 n=1 Tax=Lolium perenne TaxID=4522 RepID=UPI0021F59744|nr:uncharacterized protein LOC127306126 isoform X2 [Lolium perenne]